MRWTDKQHAMKNKLFLSLQFPIGQSQLTHPWCYKSAVVQRLEKAVSGDACGWRGSTGFSNQMINRQPQSNKPPLSLPP